MAAGCRGRKAGSVKALFFAWPVAACRVIPHLIPERGAGNLRQEGSHATLREMQFLLRLCNEGDWLAVFL